MLKVIGNKEIRDNNRIGHLVKTKPNKANAPGFARKSEILSPKSETERICKTNLKKQSQFAGGQIGANTYMKGIYDNTLPLGAQKNKANSKFTLSEAEWANSVV